VARLMRAPGRNPVRLKIELDKTLEKRIIKGIHEGMAVVTSRMKADLYESSEQLMANNRLAKFNWSNYTGKLRKMMELTDLHQSLATVPGKLRESWYKTIDNIKVDRRYNDIVVNIFNDKQLEEGTPWIGLTPKPRTRVWNNETEGEWKGKISNNVSTVYNAGYRPLPTSRGLEWSLNPYPGRGYWVLYEQGYGRYDSHHFIKESYRRILDNSEGLLGGASSIKFNEKYRKMMADKFSQYVNKEVGN